jgi:hypothetical protein
MSWFQLNQKQYNEVYLAETILSCTTLLFSLSGYYTQMPMKSIRHVVNSGSFDEASVVLARVRSVVADLHSSVCDDGFYCIYVH